MKKVFTGIIILLIIILTLAGCSQEKNTIQGSQETAGSPTTPQKDVKNENQEATTQDLKTTEKLEDRILSAKND